MLIEDSLLIKHLQAADIIMRRKVYKMSKFKRYSFEKDKGKLIDLLNLFHDYDVSFSFPNNNVIDAIDIEENKILFKIEFNSLISDSIIVHTLKQVGNQRIMEILDFNSLEDFSKLKMELITFYFSYDDMVIYAKIINPGFHKERKDNFYLDSIYLTFDNIENIEVNEDIEPIK